MQQKVQETMLIYLHAHFSIFQSERQYPEFAAEAIKPIHNLYFQFSKHDD